MYKNPSFCTAITVVRKNCENRNLNDCTVACIIDLDGTMMLYESIEELLQVVAEDLPIPDAVKVDMVVQSLRMNFEYFFHKSYEYIPARLPTPSMSAKIMMFREVLKSQGIRITPANTLNDSGKCYIMPNNLISHLPEYTAVGMSVDDKDITFLKTCYENSLVCRMTFPYSRSSLYSLKITPPQSSVDPVITFKDKKHRIAVSRKELYEYIKLYESSFDNDPNFTTHIYPDGTAANMTDYDDLEISLELSKEDIIDYLHENMFLEESVDELTDEDIYMFKLQILRIVVIVGHDVIIMPHPITPQQSIFLEAL